MLLLDAAVRSSMILLLALAAAACCRHRSAAWRHWVIAAGVCASLLTLPATAAIPAWTVAIPRYAVTAADPVDATGRETTLTVSAVTDAAPPTPWTAILLVLWGAGVAAGAIRLLAGAVRLVHLTRQAERVDPEEWTRWAGRAAIAHNSPRPVAVFITASRNTLATWGILRPHILLPSDARTWTAARAHIVLNHEIAHIRRGDWALQFAADVLRTLFWFNPLTWMASARLRRESEHACDDDVLAAGVPAHDYADHLLDIARTRRPALAWASAMSMARPSTLEGRIAAMLDHTRDRRRPTTRTRLLGLAALLAAMLPIAAVTPSAQEGPATLTIQVYDPTGGVLPGAEIVLEHAQEGTRSAVTDASGTVAFDGVAPGEHTLQATLPGFRPLRTPVALRSAADWQRAFTLQVGELMETVSVSATRTTGARPPSATGGVEALRVGGNIRAPRKLNHVAPVYPPAMRDAALEGVVPLEALIGKDGTVTSVQVLSAQVHPEFAQAAEAAVRQWQFSPTLLNGAPVDVRMKLSVRFSLED